MALGELGQAGIHHPVFDEHLKVFRAQLGKRCAQSLPRLVPQSRLFGKHRLPGVQESMTVFLADILASAKRDHEIASDDGSVGGDGLGIEAGEDIDDPDQGLLNDVLDHVGIIDTARDHVSDDCLELGHVEVVSVRSRHAHPSPPCSSADQVKLMRVPGEKPSATPPAG